MSTSPFRSRADALFLHERNTIYMLRAELLVQQQTTLTNAAYAAADVDCAHETPADRAQRQSRERRLAVAGPKRGRW